VRASGREQRRRIEIVPSILSADVGRLAEQVKEAEAAGADRIQVFDGGRVPLSRVSGRGSG
jgi:pentose-5-phosphate-3-epimerase